MQFSDLFNADLAVLSLATHMPMWGLLDKRPDRMANDGAIVNDENRMGHAAPLSPRKAADQRAFMQLDVKATTRGCPNPTL
jgi:hypothetical protein